MCAAPSGDWSRRGRPCRPTVGQLTATVFGVPEPVVELPFRRWREVEVHHADLGLAEFTIDDWSDGYVRRDLERAEMTWAARRPWASPRSHRLRWPSLRPAAWPGSGTARRSMAWRRPARGCSDPGNPVSGPVDFDDLDLEWLRSKPGAKWHRHGRGRWRRGWRTWTSRRPHRSPPRSDTFVDGGDLGYPDWPDASPLRRLFAQPHGRPLRLAGLGAEHVREVGNVVQGVQLALHLATPPGSSIALHTPATDASSRPRRRCTGRSCPSPPSAQSGGWAFDHDRFEAATSAPSRGRCRTLILCNPHNPTGHVFTLDELARLAELAEAHDLLIISDEIHADLVYTPPVTCPIASLSPAVATRTVTLTSATKAFNLAGIRCAVAHVAPPACGRRGMPSRSTCTGSSARSGSRPPGRPGRSATSGWPRPWLTWTATGRGSCALLADRLPASRLPAAGRHLPGLARFPRPCRSRTSPPTSSAEVASCSHRARSSAPVVMASPASTSPPARPSSRPSSIGWPRRCCRPSRAAGTIPDRSGLGVRRLRIPRPISHDLRPGSAPSPPLGGLRVRIQVGGARMAGCAASP